MPDTPHLIERAALRLAGGTPLARIAAPPPPDAEIARAFEPALAPTPVVKLAEIEKVGLISPNGAAAGNAEELWHVQRQLLRIAFGGAGTDGSAPPNLVLVTSARPDEGKTFTAVNLAASIARQGDHPVLLVDVDFKPKSLSGTFGVADAEGLLNCLQRDGIEPGRAICQTEIPGLWFLPRGSEPRQTPDPLARRRVGTLLQKLAFDAPERVVILDAAPCLVRGDAAALAPVVGQILLVIEAERTRKKEIEDALDLLQECPGLAVLLNKSRHPARTAQLTMAAPAYYQR